MFRVRVENLSRKGPQNRRSLGFARDDKGKGDLSMVAAAEGEGGFIVFGPATTFHITTALSFVIPSEAEGSAVLRTLPGYVFRQSSDADPKVVG